MQMRAVGLIELNSIAAGIDVADAMLKSAQVELVLARTICSGNIW
jgi:microcompartment protein CcmL/EutN